MKLNQRQKKSFDRDLRIGIVLMMVLLFVFGSQLIKAPIGGATTVLCFIVFIVLVGAYILQSNPALHKVLQSEFDRHPKKMWIFPLGLFATISIYALLTGKLDLTTLAASFVYCMAPFILLKLIGDNDSCPHWMDIPIILLLWAPITFNLLPDLRIPPAGIGMGVFNIAGLGLLIYIYGVLRNFQFGYFFRLKDKDFRVIVQNYIFLTIIALIIGFATGHYALSRRIPGISDMITSFIALTFFISLSEEILSRGVIFSLLLRMFSEKKHGLTITLIISSGLFALTDFRAPISAIFLKFIGGLFFGWTFYKTGKVTASALLHALTAWTWGTFFNG